MPPHSVLGENGPLKVTAWIDGASRGNPGPAGFGVYMKTDGGEIIEISGYLGETTNNVAVSNPPNRPVRPGHNNGPIK